MGSSKAAKGKKNELTDQVLNLRRRLHEALSLGIRQIENEGRRWQCTDAAIQAHALRAMSAFVNCLPSVPLKHHLVKESISDMLLALDGILRSKNESILCLAVDLTLKLVCSLGRSVCQYHMLDIVISLSCLLPTREESGAISCSIALNRILNNLGATSCQNSNEVWKAIAKTNIVDSVICALQEYGDGTQPIECFTEMASLLKTIIWMWSPFRYHVWSNARLMERLQDNCANNDTSITLTVLQLYSVLALCGNGAMEILKSNELVSKIVQCMGTSQPENIRLEALRLCRHLMRSAEGCSLLTGSYCEQIVRGIISAMDGWSSSKSTPSDQIPLVMEACRTALITCWPGNHHSFFWSLEIDRVLLYCLIGNCSTNCRSQAISLSEELIAKLYDNIKNTRPYIWDILGWLAIHCEEDFIPKTKGKQCCLDVLIYCACAVANDVMLKRRSSFPPDISEAEPVSRAVLLMVMSPSKYISSKARSCLSEVTRPYGDGVLENLMISLQLIATGDVAVVSDSLQTTIYLVGLACYSTLPQFQQIITKKKGLHIIVDIIGRCLNAGIHFSRSSIVSHLRNSFAEKTCCWNLVGDWEGRDIILFYSLQALSQLIWQYNSVCDNYKVTSKGIVASGPHGLISSLHGILNSNSSPGPKVYAAYILSFFGFFGIPSKLGQRMERALNENELADLQFMLSNGQFLSAHGAILSTRCPYLLPPKEPLLKSRVWHNGSTNEQEHDQKTRKSRHEVRLSDRVDYCSLIKILEYTYTGFFMAEDDLVKPLKVLANCCGLKHVSHMLNRKLPTWSSDIPTCDFSQALKPAKNSFFDIILESKASEGDLVCSICQLSMPHMHVHKIILWAGCDYLRALFQSGMHESYSQIIKVPVGWNALVKLVDYFYSGELPRIKLDCTWKNMDAKLQFYELKAYVELSSLAEFWLIEEVANSSLDIMVSCLDADQKAAADVIHYAIELGQCKIVKVAVRSIAHMYPRMRDAGDLEKLNEEAVEMLRTEYVRRSQEEL